MGVLFFLFDGFVIGFSIDLIVAICKKVFKKLFEIFKNF